MSKLTAPLVLSAGLLLSSCSATESAGPTNPSALSTGSTSSTGPSMSISARAIGPTVSTPSVVCAAASPFVVPFMVIVAPADPVMLVVTSISTQFTDSRGIAAPQVTLPAPVPTTQFGTALDQARNVQNFAVNVCVPLGQGQVTVVVNAHDMTGRNTSGRVTVPMR